MSVPIKIQNERLAVCNNCGQNQNKRCVLCGCKISDRIKMPNRYQKFRGKSYLVAPMCKLKKWPEYQQ